MDEIIQNTGSPLWFLTAVIVGIVGSLLAAYLKARIDNFFSSISEKWATRTKEKREQVQQRIAAIAASTDEAILALAEAIDKKIYGTFFFLIAFFSLVTSLILLLLARNTPFLTPLSESYLPLIILLFIIFLFVGGVLGIIEAGMTYDLLKKGIKTKMSNKEGTNKLDAGDDK
jgi:hypothetical protein